MYTIKAENIYTDVVWYVKTIHSIGTFDWTEDIDQALLFHSPISAVTALAQRVVVRSREHQEQFLFSIVVISNAVPETAEDLVGVRTKAEIDHLRSVTRLNNSLATLNESEARKLKTERRQNDV